MSKNPLKGVNYTGDLLNPKKGKGFNRVLWIITRTAGKSGEPYHWGEGIKKWEGDTGSTLQAKTPILTKASKRKEEVSKTSLCTIEGGSTVARKKGFKTAIERDLR